MLLQSRDDLIDLFPALPLAWDRAAFDSLLAAGLTVLAQWSPTGIEWSARNDSETPLMRTVRYGEQSVTVALQPGEERRALWAS
jgi:hypothetical protein